MSRKEFLKKYYGNSDYQIDVSFTFETIALDMYFFKVTSLPQITCLGNQINIDFNKIKFKP